MPVDIDELRSKALALGTEILSGPTEGAVETLWEYVFPAVFPTGIPGATKDAELVLCRIALASQVISKTLGIPARDHWRAMKATMLDRLIEPHLTSEADRAAWDALEARLTDVAFGPEPEAIDG